MVSNIRLCIAKLLHVYSGIRKEEVTRVTLAHDDKNK